MTVSYVDNWSDITEGTGTATIYKPGSAQAGDLLIVAIAARAINGDARTITPPSGWTLINETPSYISYKYAYLWTYYRVCEAGDTSWVWTYSATVDDITVCLAFRGADQSNPVPVSSEDTDTDGGANNTAPGVTMPRPGMIVAVFSASDSDTRSNTPPSGMDERYDDGTSRAGYADIMMALDTESVSIGATGDKTCTWSSGVDQASMQLIGIQAPRLGYQMIV